MSTPLTDNQAAPPGMPEIKAPSKIWTEYYYSLVLLLIAMLVGAGMFIIRPMIDGYKLKTAEAAVLQEDIANETSYFEGVSRSVAAARTIAPEVLAKVDKSLPRTFSAPENLVMLDSIAQATNVRITSVSFDALSGAGATSGAQVLGISLGIEVRSYENFKTFLKALENNLRLIDISTFNLAGFKEGEPTGLSLQMQSYYFPGAVQAEETNQAQ